MCFLSVFFYDLAELVFRDLVSCAYLRGSAFSGKLEERDSPLRGYSGLSAAAAASALRFYFFGPDAAGRLLVYLRFSFYLQSLSQPFISLEDFATCMYQECREW